VTKIKIEASAEDVKRADEDMGDFVVPPPGFYVVKLVEANAGYSKGNDGEEDKNRPRIECVYEIVAEGTEQAEPKENYGRLWDYITFSKEAGWHRANWTKALYPGSVKEDGSISVEVDTDEILERTLLARIKHEKDKRRSEEEKKTVMRARIAKFFPADASLSTEEVDTTDAYGTAEEPEEVAEVNPFDEPVPDHADSLLTEEELQGYDLKALGALAKEFDLDPMTFVVKKGKAVDQDATKAAVIAAVLEAQGSNGDGTGDASGDPF
jgi:hypothetical protein